MRKIISLILIAVLLIPNFAFAADLGIQSGTDQFTVITESQTWSESKTIDENMIIAPNVILTISSGVTITFNADLIVYGHIKNSGTLNLNRNDVYANNVKMGFSLTGDPNYLQHGVLDPAGSLHNVGGLYVDADLYLSPPISYDMPENNLVNDSTYSLRGTTVPGFTVIAGNIETVAQSDGTFELALVLEEGENLIDIRIVNVFNREFTAESLSLTLDSSVEVDGAAPQLLETQPVNASENIDINSPISFTFNEDILEGISFNAITVVNSKNEIISVETAILNNVLSLTPVLSLEPGEKYTFLLPESSLTDLIGNSLTTALTMSFKTAIAEDGEINDTPPVLVETNPLNNAVEVGLDSSVSFKFDQVIQEGIAYQDIKVEDVKNVQIPAKVIINADSLIISPETQWDFGTQYTVSIPVESVRNMEGYFNTELFSISFTTIEEVVEEIPLPAKPVVNPVIEGYNQVTGTADIGTVIYIESGENVWSNSTNDLGEFTVEIEPQLAGTELRVYAQNQEGLKSEEAMLFVLEAQGSIGGTQLKGQITQDTIWTKANSPYTLAGQVEVTDGATLTLEPGVEVQGQGNRLVITDGFLQSKGTSEEHIAFKDTRVDAGYYARGAMDIHYTDFNGGAFQKSGSGTLTLKDSHFNTEVNLYLTEANSVIERNVFKLTYLYMSINSRYNHTIRNNLFYNGFNGYSYQKISYSGYEWDAGQTLFEHNSFIGGEGSKTPIIEVSHSTKGISVLNNYWNTVNEQKIDDKIYDGKDKVNDPVILLYKPFLTAPHADTPKLDALTITDVTPEVDGYGVPVNSEVTITFDREIDPLQLQEWKFNVRAENGGYGLWTKARVEKDKVILSFPEGMTPNTKYVVEIQAGAVTGKDGAPLLEPPYFSFLTSISPGPPTPSVNQVTDSTMAVTGITEPESLVTVKVGFIVIGSSTADQEGNYSVSIPKQQAGTKLNITATDSRGNISNAQEVTVIDDTAPNAPTVNKVTDKTTTLSGKTEAGATIIVKEGALILGSTIADREGAYSIVIPQQKAGSKLSITALDAVGNISEEKVVTVLDETAPNAPIVDKVTDNSTIVTGSGEINSLISIKADSVELGTGNVASDGKFKVTISAQKAGTIIQVTSKDIAGNTSVIKEVTVADVTAPTMPYVKEVTDKSILINGTAEAATQISVKADSIELGNTTVDADGNFSVSIQKQKAGRKLSITATDTAGNVSDAKLLAVLDATAPDVLSVEKVTDQSSTILGMTEANASILVKTGDKELGKVTADETGRFDMPIEMQLRGTVLKITATDQSGNISPVKEVIVSDGTPPAAPLVNKVTDKSIAVTGSGEANALITVKAGTTVLGSAKVEADGTYSVTIPKQKAGTKLSVTATDAAGNISSPKEVIVIDVTAPNLPIVNKVTEQATTVNGTAEVAAVISVKAGTSVIGTATVKADGTYSVAIPKQKVGTVLTVAASDKDGNTSLAKEVIVLDGTAPAVELTSKVTQHSIRVIGTAEAGAKIAIHAGTKSIGTAVADAKGNYEVVIANQKVGSKLSIVAIDAAGNSSAPLIITVEDGNYPDLKLTHWALDEIMYLADDQIIGGYPNGGFQPEKKTTRAEAAKMLALAMDLPVKDVSSGYKDVSNKHWAKNYIAAVSKAGLFGGNPDGTFAPDAVLKRAEMAKVISIAYELKASTNNHFKDVKSGYWAKGYISGLYENGITTGYPDNTFRAEESTTRAEFSVFLARALNQDFR